MFFLVNNSKIVKMFIHICVFFVVRMNCKNIYWLFFFYIIQISEGGFFFI